MGCVDTERAGRPRARVPPPTPRPRRALLLCCDRADHSPQQMQARGGSASQGPKTPQPSRRRQSRRRPSRHSLVAAALQKHPGRSLSCLPRGQRAELRCWRRRRAGRCGAALGPLLSARRPCHGAPASPAPLGQRRPPQAGSLGASCPGAGASTRPFAFGEEDVPRNPHTASATGAAATIVSRVPMIFGYARGPFEGDPERSLASAGIVRGLVGRIGPMR
eukprot:scaffold61039_cov75-Phaeocystis_antarctica.AAC.1